MKIKSRIISLLLVFLTVIGIDPFSLSVAADGNGDLGVTSLYGHSLNLNDDIEVLFFLDADTEGVEGAKVRIGLEKDFGDENKLIITSLDALEVKMVDGKSYYVAAYGVSAKDMAENVKAEVVLADGTVDAEYVYSVCEYINGVVSAETGGRITAELKALINALDVYGRNAAAVLMGGEIQETIDGVDFSDVTDAGGSRVGEAIRLEQFSLELKSNIKLRVYFEITDDSVAESFTASINGERVNVTKVKNGIWCIEQAVTATELNENFTFTVSSGENTLTFRFSALYYAKLMSEKAETDAEKNLMKAIKLYSDAALRYKESVA